MKKEYTSIKDGYFVNRDSGYGIISGNGQVGSLIVQEGNPVGIVTQIGKD